MQLVSEFLSCPYLVPILPILAKLWESREPRVPLEARSDPSNQVRTVVPGVYFINSSPHLCSYRQIDTEICDIQSTRDDQCNMQRELALRCRIQRAR